MRTPNPYQRKLVTNCKWSPIPWCLDLLCVCMGSTYVKPCANIRNCLRVMFLRRPKAVLLTVRASARRQLRTDALDAVSIACIDVWTFATFLVFFFAALVLLLVNYYINYQDQSDKSVPYSDNPSSPTLRVFLPRYIDTTYSFN